MANTANFCCNYG